MIIKLSCRKRKKSIYVGGVRNGKSFGTCFAE